MKVVVLADNRPGTANQAIALAELLGYEYKVVNLRYNVFAKLPNFLRMGRFYVSPKIRKEVINLKPDIIISAGRRSAAVAVSIKKNLKGSRLLQIMKPDLHIKHFDALLLPEHDKVKRTHLNHPNIIRIHGALTYYSEEAQLKDREYWLPILRKKGLKKPRITLLLGGNTKHYSLDLNFARKIYDNIVKIAKENEACLMVSTSRRTPEKVVEMYRDRLAKLDIPHYFYSPVSSDENPYRGFLTCADWIFITGDSISMISEALETGKQVYIITRSGMLSQKHKSFVDKLIKKKYVRLMEDFTPKKLKTKYPKHKLRDKIFELLNIS